MVSKEKRTTFKSITEAMLFEVGGQCLFLKKNLISYQSKILINYFCSSTAILLIHKIVFYNCLFFIKGHLMDYKIKQECQFCVIKF